jgi:hypothetical protein
MAERQVLQDPVLVRFIHEGLSAQPAAALGALGGTQVTPSRMGADGFAAGRDLESLGHGLSGLNAFGSSHNSSTFRQKSAKYR